MSRRRPRAQDVQAAHPAWAAFADAVLHRAARRRHAQLGRGVDPLAGSVARDDDVDRLIGELPTLADDGASAPTSLDEAVAATREALHDVDEPGVLGWLVGAAGLDRTAVEVLALAGAVTWSPARLRLLGYVQDDLTVRGLMVDTLASLLEAGPDAVLAVAPDAQLRRACLLDVDQPELGGAARVVVPPALQWYLLGDESRDPALPRAALVLPGPPVTAEGRWLVHGPDRVRRLQAAARLTGTTRMLVTPEPADDDEWGAVVRSAVCRGTAVVLEAASLSPAAGSWLERAAMVAWVVSSRDPLPLDGLPPLPFVEHEAAADGASDEEVRAVLGEIPAGHRLRAEQLHVLGRIEGIRGGDAVRRLASAELHRLATRIRPERVWADLVLPPDRLGKVAEIASRARHRGVVHDEWGFRAVPSPGVVALFAGPSGTGKTMAAEIIAGDLGVDLFKIDLSSIVSKYIGETEQHLEQLFTAAEGSGVLLLFDEADALFGKRTKVQDSHDRYANIETSYLLQRIERYDGLTVLTSNLASNIDEAFLRRVHVFVDFPMPEAPQRRAIWAASFPATAPLGAIDLDELAARFPLSGGAIRTASLTAAFVAAADGGPLEMHHVVYGLMREYEKLGRMITPEQFGDWTDTALSQRAGSAAGVRRPG